MRIECQVFFIDQMREAITWLIGWKDDVNNILEKDISGADRFNK